MESRSRSREIPICLCQTAKPMPQTWEQFRVWTIITLDGEILKLEIVVPERITADEIVHGLYVGSIADAQTTK